MSKDLIDREIIRGPFVYTMEERPEARFIRT